MEIESIKQKVLEDVDPVMKKKKAKRTPETTTDRDNAVPARFCCYHRSFPFFYGDIDS